MKHRYLSAIIIIILMTVLAGCSSKKEVTFTRTAAREMTDDGWVYTVEIQRMKDPSLETSGFVRYRFYAINIRSRYDEDFIQTEVHEGKDSRTISTYIPAILIWGQGSDAQARDMELINNGVMRQNATAEELLALDESAYEFETVDRSMFFRLMRQALTSQPHAEPSDIKLMDKPSYGLLQETEFLDGYKFQVGFIDCMGYADEVFIDVLYEDDGSPVGYIQLSDMVDNGTASNEQVKLFDKIKELCSAIRGTEYYCAKGFDFSEVIADVEFDRLSGLLKDLDDQDYTKYSVDPIVLKEEVIEK